MLLIELLLAKQGKINIDKRKVSALYKSIIKYFSLVKKATTKTIILNRLATPVYNSVSWAKLLLKETSSLR